MTDLVVDHIFFLKKRVKFSFKDSIYRSLDNLFRIDNLFEKVIIKIISVAIKFRKNML